MICLNVVSVSCYMHVDTVKVVSVCLRARARACMLVVVRAGVRLNIYDRCECVSMYPRG